MSQTKETIADRLRSVRGALGVGEFAEELGVNRKTVTRWENGDAVPDGDSLLALQQVFSVDPAWLLLGEPADGWRAQVDFILRDNAARKARGEPEIPGMVAALQGIAATPRRMAARSAEMDRANLYLSALDDAGFADAMEMLLHYGGMSSGNRNIVNQLVSSLAASSPPRPPADGPTGRGARVSVRSNAGVIQSADTISNAAPLVTRGKAK
jgi:transcriptional regulator with XRE-family HTH domain